MLFKRKDISEYNILEKVKIDIDDVNRLYRIGLPSSQSGPREYCELVAKDNRYNFYGYRTYSDGSGGYILRQVIKNQKKVVFFGKSKKYNIVFNGYLFQVNEYGEVGDYSITARNIEDGKLIEYDWLSEKAVFVSVNGFGRFNCQDQVKKVFTKDDKLIFKVSRTKSKDPYHEYQPDKYDINTQYDLVVEYKVGRFVATKVFPDEAASEGKQEKPSEAKHASTMQIDKRNSIGTGTVNSTFQINDAKKKYWMDNKGIVRCPGDACPEDCDLSCPIYVQTLALEKFTKDDYAGAAKLFQKAVDIEPAFADAWNNLAACYGQMGDDQKAYDAYKKSFMKFAILI